MIPIVKTMRDDISPGSFALVVDGVCHYDGHDDSVRVIVCASDKYWRLSGLYVPETVRRQGLGRELVTMAMHEAKAAGVPLFLQPEPFGQSPMSVEVLAEWYLRLGFRFVAVAANPAPLLMRWKGGEG